METKATDEKIIIAVTSLVSEVGSRYYTHLHQR